MIARMLSAPGRPRRLAAGLILLSIAGCHGIGKSHEAKHIPQYGVIDPTQARELHKVPFPPHVVEPPDELEIAVKPPIFDGGPATVVVQADGFLDLGFAGDVFVTGLTLAEAEERIALHLAGSRRPAGAG